MKKLFLLLLVTLLASCQFQSDDEFFKDIPPPNQEGIDILLQDATSFDLTDVVDTVSFFRRVDLRVNIELDGRRTIESTVDINGQVIVSNRASGGWFTFTVNPHEWGTGFHKLTLKMITTTGSGSLADINEMEFFEVERSWILDIDIDAPDELEIQQIALDDGQVRVTWPRYDRSNFQEYTIQKWCYNVHSPDQLGLCYEWTVKDQNVLSLLDTGHLQGNVSYSLRIKAADQYSFGPVSTEFEIPSKLGFKIKGKEDGSHVLSWTRPYLEKGFDFYYIEEDAFIDEHIQTINSLADTVYTHDPGLLFGQYITYRVSTFGIGQSLSRIIQTRRVPAGVEIPAFSFLDSSPAHESIYFNIDQPDEVDRRLVRASISTVARLDSISFSQLSGMDNESHHDLIVSADGRRIFVLNKRLLHELDPISLSVIDSFDLSGLDDGQTDTSQSYSEVSGNGLLKVHIGRSIYLYDLANRSQVLKVESSYGWLSPNGNWLIVNKKIFKKVNGIFEQHEWVYNPPAHTIGFMSNGTQYFKYTWSNTMEIVDLETAEVIENIPLVDETIFGWEQSFFFDRLSGQYYSPRPTQRTDLLYRFSSRDRSISTIRLDDTNTPDFFQVGDRLFNVHGAYRKFQ